MKIFLLMAFYLVNSMVYDPTQFYLGDNLIVNSLFDNPLVSDFLMTTSMIGWTCTPQCEINNSTYLCTVRGFPCANK